MDHHAPVLHSLEREMRNVRLSTSHWTNHGFIKDAFRRTAKTNLCIREHRNAITHDEKIHWALSALRAFHRNDESSFRSAIGAAPSILNGPINSWPPGAAIIDSVRVSLFDACVASAEERQNLINEAKMLPTYHDSNHLHKPWLTCHTCHQ